MLRLFGAFVAFFIALCAQANEFTVNPFDVFIIHPKTYSQTGILKFNNRVLLTFPFNDDIQVTNCVNDARRQNRLLKFMTYSDPNNRTLMQIDNFFPYDDFIEYLPGSVSFCGSKKIDLVDITVIEPYISYKTGNNTKKITIFFEHVEDYLSELIARAKRENKKILLNPMALRHKKKQQYMPLKMLADIVENYN